ncbi:MAG: pectin esterase [Ignavibacteriae bacterium]|nr:MAG: pectin esterase [Ignavibacteriota bacterium]
MVGLLLFSCGIPGRAQTRPDFIVALDGSGNFKTVQEAINAVPDLRNQRTAIMIKNGIYKEKLILPPTKINVTFVGESAEKTILTYDDYAQKKNCFGEEMGTSGSSSIFIYGDGFIAENITFENSAGPVGQAVAVRIDGDRVKFVNCRFLGFQDTLYPHGEKSRQYFKNCTIEGTVDFIFGWSTAVFDRCRIFCKGGGIVTAASTLETSRYGFVFLNCMVTGDAPQGSVYLGRPWRPFAKVAYINCNLGAMIHPEGWSNWNKTETEKTAYFSEYNNTGDGFQPGKRVTWSHQLTPDEAAHFSLQHILGDWNPLTDCSGK